MNTLTQNLLRELFNYRDGELYWKVSTGPRAKIGDRAGSDRKDEYRRIGISGKAYKAHRLIFLWHHGYLPEYLDHIDGNPANNSIENLREATSQENHWNQKKTKFINGKPPSSQFKGVSWDKEREKWRAYIQIDGKRKHLGYHDSEIDAALAYDRAAIKYFGKYAVTNAMLFPRNL